jgi:CheY-like chemotaxis protein
MTLSTVLIVEDEPGICEALADLLSDCGYPVATAGDGVEALAYLREHPRPGLVILDLMLPTMSGTEFLAELASDPQFQSLPTAVVSASHELRHPLPGPVVARLPKPIDIPALLRTVETHAGVALGA